MIVQEVVPPPMQDVIVVSGVYTLPFCGSTESTFQMRPPGAPDSTGTVQGCFDATRGPIFRLVGGGDPGCLYLQNFRHCGMRAAPPDDPMPGDVYIDITGDPVICVRELDNTDWDPVPVGGTCA